MKLEDLEEKLRALAPSMLDSTPQWKQHILAAAKPRPPRLLLACLSSAWLCILGLWLSTPEQPSATVVRETSLITPQSCVMLLAHHIHTLTEIP
jgi:hypothetical protein